MTLAAGQLGSWTDPASRRTFGYRLWRPAKGRSLLVLAHGFGEHGGRYAAFAQALTAQGLWVAAPDWWGHGRSGGPRGDLGDLWENVAQLVRMTEAVFLPASGQSRYALFGHSFGGLAVIAWAHRHPERVSRLITQSPLVEVGFPIPRWKEAVAWTVGHCLPFVTMPMDIDLTRLCRNAAVIKAYRTDPLVHHQMSFRTYHATLRTRDEILAKARELRVPALLLCGEQDRIISVPAAFRWFERLTCEKHSIVFPGAYHELHNDGLLETVVHRIAEWAG